MFSWGLGQLCGGLLLLLQPVLPDVRLALAVFPVAAVLLVTPRWRWVAAVGFGAALALLDADDRQQDRLAASFEGEIFEVTGRVVDLVERQGRQTRFRFQVETALHHGQPVTLPGHVRLNAYQPLPVRTGERWRLRVKLRRPRGFGNPGGFDYERWTFSEGIGAAGYVRDVHTARRVAEGSREWRAAVASRVEALAQGPAAGLVRGLATADRTGISDTQWDVLRATGTAHLMAISGLHIGLVTALGLGLATLLRRRFAPAVSTALPPLAGAVLAFAYGALAGFDLPVQRALAGTVVLLAALALRRNIAPGHAFGLALTTVLCFDPLAPLDTGFWMSFGAVAAIMFIAAGRRPRGGKGSQLLRVQLGLFVLLAPLTVATFGLLPLVSPLANLIAIPVFGLLVVPLILLALLFLWYSPLAELLLLGAGRVLELLFSLLEWLAAQGPPLAPSQPEPLAWIVAVPGLLLLTAPRALPGRSLATWLLLPAGLTMLASWLPPDRAAPPLQLHFLDVGQGLAVVVETPSSTTLFDTGPGFGANDAAGMVVIPFLRTRARQPDRIIVSHGDNDHAGGLATLREHFPHAAFSGRADRADAMPDCAGQAWSVDDVEFRMLNTRANLTGSNDESCVLRIQYNGFVALLTGDMERAGEARLLAAGEQQLRANVVQVPHHGSRTSSTPAFVAATGAQLAVAAAGFGNQWNFPKPDIVQRWNSAGAELLVTGTQGAISISVADSSFCVTTFREQARLWRDPAPPPGTRCRRFGGWGK